MGKSGRFCEVIGAGTSRDSRTLPLFSLSQACGGCFRPPASTGHLPSPVAPEVGPCTSLVGSQGALGSLLSSWSPPSLPGRTGGSLLGEVLSGLSAGGDSSQRGETLTGVLGLSFCHLAPGRGEALSRGLEKPHREARKRPALDLAARGQPGPGASPLSLSPALDSASCPRTALAQVLLFLAFLCSS